MEELKLFLKQKLEKYGQVFNLDEILNTISNKSIKDVEISDLENIFNDIEERYYFDSSLSDNDYKTVYDSKELPQFKFLILNKSSILFRKKMCISFKAILDMNNTLIWKGCLFGNISTIYEKCKRRKIDNSKKYEGYADTVFFESLYQNLFLQERWCTLSNNEKNYDRLYFYLTNLCAAIKSRYGKQQNLYIENSFMGMNYIVFDSRLLDRYGNKIYLIHSINKSQKDGSETIEITFSNPIFIANLEILISYGFNQIDINDIKPLILYTDPSELIFDGNIESIDLEDTYHLKHIIDERRERLPNNFRNKSALEIYLYLKISVEFAVKMSKLNYAYIVPSYSLANNEIQYLIPFYEQIGQGNPICAIVISKSEGRWMLRTILPIDVAYNNARLLGIPNAEWFN